MDGQNEPYNDPRFEMFSEKSQFKAMVKAYIFAFLAVIFIIMPWAVGACMLIKWIIF
ncbi:MAG TPA: hypothetical protein VMX17_08555 [Candidatus Glassbacteria bacterium]|nr:hypothetical protein [Candidatus Glassbacteria bacterium]